MGEPEVPVSVPRFLGWVAVGFTFTFSFTTGFGIGVIVLPIAAALLILMLTVGRSREQDKGMAWATLAGIGLALMLYFAVNTNLWPALFLGAGLFVLGCKLPLKLIRERSEANRRFGLTGSGEDPT